MEEESKSSVQEEPKKDQPKVVKEMELDSLANELPLHSVVNVLEKGFRPHILLDDVEGKKFWNPVHTNEQFTIEMNEKFKRSQKLYKEKTPSTEQHTVLREVLTAISTVGNYLEYDENIVGDMIDLLIVKFSFNVYKEQTGYTGKLEELQGNAEFTDYINMTVSMIKSFTELHAGVQASVDQAVVEQEKQTPVQKDN